MKIDWKKTIDAKVGMTAQEAKARGFRAANELRNAALHVLRGTRSGRVYKKPYSRAHYRASAPGEPPAVRSGDLRRSWRAVSGSKKAGTLLTVKPAIRTDIKYAPILQDGGKRMAARPYEESIIEKVMPNIKKIYGEPYLK